MPSSDSSPALDPALVAPLEPGENALASLDVDLDSADRFAAGRLVLTDRRLLAHAPGSAAWQAWPLAAALSLQHTDHGGIGQLSLHDERARLAVWRYTLGADPAALKLLGLFERQRQRLIHGITEADEPAEAEETDFAAESPTPPSTWVLLRLSRFARPYRWQLLLGFALMLISTAASLVPPYLTIPLMDEVLIPYQNGKQIDTGLVWMLLAGLFGAALVAWALGWWRTWLLALVSERIGADLRTATFDHLLQLSLDYFGSKRTGDLMSRIGSESDRICVFLSLHALDFATDVLMIGMTAVILFNINPSLALVTLLPLPFIAWMIHLVRDRLRTGFEKIDRVWGEVTSVLADTTHSTVDPSLRRSTTGRFSHSPVGWRFSIRRARSDGVSHSPRSCEERPMASARENPVTRLNPSLTFTITPSESRLMMAQSGLVSKILVMLSACTATLACSRSFTMEIRPTTQRTVPITVATYAVV